MVVETRDVAAESPGAHAEHRVPFTSEWLDMIALKAPRNPDLVPVADQRIARAMGIIQEALAQQGAGGARSVPSAGALFPYDIVLLTEEERDGALRPTAFKVDLVRRFCLRLPVAAEPVEALHTELARGCTLAHPDHFLVLARPWLSMRKYGPRGHLYTHLDAGHAATNLLGIALGRGPAELRLRIPRLAIRELLGALLPYREAHSVISVAPSGPAPRNDQVWIADQAADAPADSHGAMEEFCWSQIPQELPEGGDPMAPVMSRPVVDAGDRLSQLLRIGRHEWRLLARLRRSCKTFAREATDAPDTAAALNTLLTPLPTDLQVSEGKPGAGLRISVVVAPGPVADACRAWLPSADIRLIVSEVVADPDGMTRLCQGQGHISAAQALVLFHVPRDRFLVPGRPQALRDLLFQASAAAQLLYLGATRQRVAVTAVGGFDAYGLREVAGLGSDEEVVYLLALGADGGGKEKTDRLAIAHAHGE